MNTKNIALVDCDSFFVSCEQLMNPSLINKPVCVASNNDGCVIARSKEAKAIGMNTIFGDGSSQEEGLMGKLLGAGKRLLTGATLFMTVFTNNGQGKQHVSFSAPYPGKIIPMDLNLLDGKIVCQKDSFLCAAKGVSIGMEFTKRLGAGFFGGRRFCSSKT